METTNYPNLQLKSSILHLVTPHVWILPVAAALAPSHFGTDNPQPPILTKTLSNGPHVMYLAYGTRITLW